MRLKTKKMCHQCHWTVQQYWVGSVCSSSRLHLRRKY